MVLARRGLVSWPWILFLNQICACHDHKGRGVQIPQEDSVLPLGFSPQCFPLRPSTASAILCPDWSTHQHVSRWIEHWITWYAPFALHRGRNSSRSLGSRATMRSRWHCVESIRYHSAFKTAKIPILYQWGVLSNREPGNEVGCQQNRVELSRYGINSFVCMDEFYHP